MDNITKSYYEGFKEYCETNSFHGPTTESILLKFLEEFLNEDEILGFYYQPQELIALTSNGIFKFTRYNEYKEMYVIPLALVKNVRLVKKPNQDYNVLITYTYNKDEILLFTAKNERDYGALKMFIKNLIKEL